LQRTEIEEWKMRLQHAHNEWQNAGLIPDSQSGLTDRYSLMQYLDGYRGDFPRALDGATEMADQFVGNIMFSIVNSLVSGISARNPDPIVRPIGGAAADASSRRRAWINEQIIRFILRERKFKEEVDMALLSAVLSPFGIVQHGYTPEVEFEDDNGTIITRFKNQTPDLPWIQFVRPWQVRIDPMVNSFAPDSEPRWVCFHKLYFASQIKKNENLIFRKDLNPTWFQDLRFHEDRDKGSGSQPLEGDRNVMPMYEEWLFYDADERRVFGISPGCDDLIREETEWPIEWGQLPFSYLSFNPQLDTPFGIPFPQMFYGEQLLYNKIWTIINAMVSRVRRLIVYRKDAFDAGEEANLTNPDSIVEAVATIGDPSAVIRELPFGAIDGQLVGLTYQLKEQIREVLGVSSFDRGQRANVETAAEANAISAGGMMSRGRTQEKFEAFWANVIRTTHRSFLQSEDARQMIVPIVGAENLNFLEQSDRERGFLTVNLADLQGEFEYAVRLDSTLKIDPAVQLSKTASGFNLLGGVQSQLLNQRFYHERITELSGEDPQQAVMGEQATNEMARQQQGAGEEGASQDMGAVSTAQQGLPDIRAIGGS